MTIEEMRALLGLGPEVSDEDVAAAYALYLEGEAPPAPLITLEDAKRHLAVYHDDDNAMIEAMIAAAIGHIDGPTGILGRAVAIQTLPLRLSSFPIDPIRLPYPPALSVESVTYLDAAGTRQTVDPALYALDDGLVEPVWGARWPPAARARGSVRISYTAGYTVLPASLRAALLLMVGDLYAQRETFVTGTISSKVPMSMAVENLLAPFRVAAPMGADL